MINNALCLFISGIARWIGGTRLEPCASRVNQSQFICDPSEIPLWNTTGGQIGPWFFVENGPVDCADPCLQPRYPTSDIQAATAPGPQQSKPLDAAEQKAAKGEYEDESFNWMMRQALYHDLKNAPERANEHPDVAAFYNSAPQTPLGQFYELGQRIRNLAQGNAPEQTFRAALYQRMLNAAAAVRTLQQTNAPNLQITLKLADVFWYSERLRQIDEQKAIQMKAEAHALLLENATITAPNICAQNEKLFNALYLEHELWTAEVPTVPVLNALKSIADQCPFTGGFAVYQARGLYHRFVQDANWDQATVCVPEPEEQGRSSQQRESGFRVFPNPAVKEITVSGKFPSEQETRFELYNTAGILLTTYVLPAGETNTRVSLPELSSGLYYYSILMDGAAVAHGKLMVQY